MDKEILIEFYDRESLENIISLESDRYRRVVYFYFADDGYPDQQQKKILSSFIRRRCGLEPEFLPIAKRSMDGIVSAFDELLRDGSSAVIDLTGGAEGFSAAAGWYLAKSGRENVTLQQHDIRRDHTAFCYPDCKRRTAPPTMTVSDSVALQGAIVMSSTPYRADDVMEDEILRLWNTVRHIPKQWNQFCGLPSARRQYGSRFDKCVSAQKDADAYEAVSRRLRQNGMLMNESSFIDKGKKYKAFTLTVPQDALMLYRKAGNLLEMYCALAASRAGSFQDCHVSVKMDWDSEILHYVPNTTNEIDVMLTYGHIPVLVSCKNTHIEKEYLYEIAVMAKHYGGRYARPVIVSSVENDEHVRLRAEEMGVLLIDNVQNDSLEEFIQRFRKTFPPRT